MIKILTAKEAVKITRYEAKKNTGEIRAALELCADTTARPLKDSLNAYSVGHLGAKGMEVYFPYFLARSYCTVAPRFTNSFFEAAIFPTLFEAQEIQRQIEDYLHQSSHPLASRTSVLELCYSRVPEKEVKL